MAIWLVAWSRTFGGAAGEEAVPLRVGIGAEVEEHFAGIVNIHIGIHDDDGGTW